MIPLKMLIYCVGVLTCNDPAFDQKADPYTWISEWTSLEHCQAFAFDKSKQEHYYALQNGHNWKFAGECVPVEKYTPPELGK